MSLTIGLRLEFAHPFAKYFWALDNINNIPSLFYCSPTLHLRMSLVFDEWISEGNPGNRVHEDASGEEVKVDWEMPQSRTN